MSAAKGPTKGIGKVCVYPIADEYHGFRIYNENDNYHDGITMEMRHDHARLIQDAFNVYSETGLTPREMMVERGRMMEVLEEIAYKDGSFCDCRNPPDMCDCAQRKAREALSPEKKEADNGLS